MPFNTVRKETREVTKTIAKRQRAGGSLVDEAYRKILAMITEGALTGGERLPTEGEMASSIGVSRPVVRQALSQLQHAGVVEVRWGSGTYVQKPGAVQEKDQSFAPVRSLDEVRHAYMFRATIEGEAAALAAEQGSKQALQGVYDALEKLEKALSTSAEAQEADLEFHMAIAAASGDPFYLRTLISVRPSVEFSINLLRTLSLTHPRDRLLIVQAEHVAVLKAIEAGDADAARSAMQLHLNNACKRLFQGPGA